TTTAVPTTTSVTTVPPVTTTTATTTRFTATCSGVKDGNIVCRSDTTFNFCVGGTFLYANSQSCAPGTVCCEASNQCDFAFNCGSLPKDPTDRCYGKKDNDIICTSANSFKVCQGQTIGPFPELTCQAGLACCESLNRCDYPSVCPTLTGTLPTATLPPPATTTTGVTVPTIAPSTCAGTANGNIICKTLKTFNFCINGAFIDSADQTCPPGTSTRPTTSALPPAPSTGFGTTTAQGPVPTIAPATCIGRTNGNIICTSSTSFNICLNGGLASLTDQTCPPGTVCCQSSNTCDFASNCAPVVVIPPSTPSQPVTTTAPVVPPVTSVQTSGVVPTTTTAAAPYNPPGLGSCSKIPNGEITCVSRSEFKYCFNGELLQTAALPCPPGTVCCASVRMCTFADLCPDSTGTLPTATTTTVAPIATTAPIYSRDCAGSTGLKCTSDSTFNFCENGVFVTNVDQKCAAGLVCCPTLNNCVYSKDCPVLIGTSTATFEPPVPVYTGLGTVGDSCNGVADGAILCTSEKEYNYCISN
ncbi:hypothetical protein HDU67_002679, partial [Dinochytrium kinnereticum]